MKWNNYCAQRIQTHMHKMYVCMYVPCNIVSCFVCVNAVEIMALNMQFNFVAFMVYIYYMLYWQSILLHIKNVTSATPTL